MKKEYIKFSKFSTEYSILFAFKKNDKLHLCVDYRKLNDITIKNRYSLFNVNEIQDKLSQTTIFIKLNLRDEYHFIQIKKKKEWKTVFQTQYEHYKYMIMSFKLTNVSTIFQEFINDALREHLNNFVTIYLNDILIYLRTLAKHEQHVKIMLDCLKKRNLRFKSKKCEFHKKKVVYLKYVISKTRIFIKSIKLNVIKKWKRLTNVKKVQSFIDFVNYNRKFIKKFS